MQPQACSPGISAWRTTSHLRFASSRASPFLARLAGGRRILLGLGSLLVASAVFLTFARSAWYGLVAAVLVFALLAGGRPKWRWLSFGSLFIALLFAANTGFRARVLSSFVGSSNEDRLKIWQVCSEVVERAPLFGVGFGNLPAVAKPIYSELYPNAWVRAYCHNTFFTAYAEGGALLLLAVLFYFFGLARSYYRRQREPTADPLARAAAFGALAGLAAMLVNSLTHDIFYASESMYGLGFLLAVSTALCSDA